MVPNRKRFRSRTNYLLACVSEMIGPFIWRRAVARSTAEASPPEAWRRGIIIGADHIGDMLFNTASLPYLNEGLSKCRWYHVADPPASGVLAQNPNIEGIVSRVDLSAMRGSFDVAVCYNSGSNWRDLIFVTKLGIPNRIGYIDKGFSSLVTFPIQITYPQPYPAYFRDLIGQLVGRKPDWALRPMIYPSSKDGLNAETAWIEAHFDPAQPVVACFVTSRQPAGVWPAEKFAQAISIIEEEANCQTVLCGTTDDAARLNQLKSDLKLRARLFAGKLSLLSLGCFLRKCAVVLCPDSGPRHLANAVGTPVVYVRNIAVKKIETGSYCDTEIDVAPDFECISPSDQERMFCLIDPRVVAERVGSLLVAGPIRSV